MAWNFHSSMKQRTIVRFPRTICSTDYGVGFDASENPWYVLKEDHVWLVAYGLDEQIRISLVKFLIFRGRIAFPCRSRWFRSCFKERIRWCPGCCWTKHPPGTSLCVKIIILLGCSPEIIVIANYAKLHRYASSRLRWQCVSTCRLGGNRSLNWNKSGLIRKN